MATLVIRGHETRGKEVIEILEMLGGENKYNLMGNDDVSVYYVNNREIFHKYPSFVDDAICFTLEEFLVKFPYKVGDKVLYRIYNVYSSIKTMTWNEEKEQVIYRLDSKNLWVSTADELEEGTIKPITIEDFKANSKEWLIDTLESMSKDDALQTICDLHDELHKPQFPTTYEECCKVLNIIPNNKLVFSNPNEESEYAYRNLALYNDLDKLKVCRDAYCKMAGDWKPDWTNGEFIKYSIRTVRNTPCKDEDFYANRVLAFPTEEIRDAFYENFKELINETKELL